MALTRNELWKTADIDTLRREIEMLQRKDAAYAALVAELRAEALRRIGAAAIQHGNKIENK